MLPHWIISLNGGPQRVNHSAVVIEHKIYIFGGYCSTVDYEQSTPIDVHLFNTYNNRWMKVNFKNKTNDNVVEAPYMRYGHASVAVGNLAYLWGGRNDCEGACNKLFVFDTKSFKWKQPKVNGIVPDARDGHAMCLCQGNIYMFGGFEDERNRFSNDLFVLELPNHLWRRIVYKNTLVASWRDFHSINALGKHLYVFGGRGDQAGPINSQFETYDNELKVFDIESRMWFRPIKHVSKLPCGRRSHSAFTYNACLYIFGGYNANMNRHFNDLWKYDPELQRWFRVKTIGCCPSPRRRQSCCLHEGRLYLFGGSSPAFGDQYDRSFEGDVLLLDHDDLHVLDFCPSLQTLCLNYLAKNDFNLSQLPPHIQWKVSTMKIPQPITEVCCADE